MNIQLNIQNWQKFIIGDLFTLIRGQRLKSDDRIKGNIPYFSASELNNGLSDKISNPLFIESNAILYTSFGDAFYVENIFTTSDEITLLKHKKLNLYNALFIVTVLKLSKFKYQFGRKAFQNKFKNETIKLPHSDNSPDWEFMENYILNRLQKNKLDNIMQTSVLKKNILLNMDSWKNFKLSDLFTFKRGKRLTQEDRITGNIPFVTAGEGNQGVKDFISNDSQEIYNHCITIDMFCNSYYHGYDFCCDDNILALSPKQAINKYAMIFISTIITKDKYQYQYGRQYRIKNFQKHSIKLPSTPSNTPDWAFMEDYIKSLPYSNKI